MDITKLWMSKEKPLFPKTYVRFVFKTDIPDLVYSFSDYSREDIEEDVGNWWRNPKTCHLPFYGVGVDRDSVAYYQMTN